MTVVYRSILVIFAFSPLTKLTDQGINIRLAKLVVSFPFYRYAEAVTGLQTGLKISFKRSFIPQEALFLGDLQGDSFVADVRFYFEPGATTQPLEENILKGSPSVKEIPEHEAAQNQPADEVAEV